MPWRERTRAYTSRVFPVLLVYLALIVVIDSITPRSLRLDVFAALAPLIAAAVCTYRQTLVLGLLDLVVMAITHGVIPDSLVPLNRVASVLGNTLMVGASIAVARLLRDREELLAQVRATGEAAQRALLRELPLRSGDMVVDGFYVSSQQGALVGGDIYEVVDTPYGPRVLIGDVQGKGLRALGAGAAVLTSFREAAYHLRSLSGGVNAMEVGLRRYNSAHRRDRDANGNGSADGDGGGDGGGSEGEGAEERFVTALVFGLEWADSGPAGSEVPADGGAPDPADTVWLVLIDCGHVRPYLLQADGTVSELEPPEPGLPLGLGDLMGTPRPIQRVPIRPDTRVFACTDGVTEARCPAGEFYPLADRLGGWASLPTPELLRRLREDLDAHTKGRLQDDAAALVLEHVPGQRVPGRAGLPGAGEPG
ncbi:PP2C family protein-serine/threonine phosphatase [Streptomyces cuspidosporus]|uniref:PP2C family serine/threonine-protein phosphatase n=1 Tax=Streptomyces cuspidosporus TaxID=66882 RepID=A0ABN3H5V5_9ACTN